MKTLKEIAAGIGLVFGAVIAFFWWKDSQDSKVLADNEKVKDSLKKTDEQIAVNNAANAQEEIVRNQLKEDIKKTEENKDEENPNNVVDFFNSRK